MAPKRPSQIFANYNDSGSEHSNTKAAASKDDDELLQQITDRMISTYLKTKAAAAPPPPPHCSDRTTAQLLMDITGDDFAKMTIIELSKGHAALKMAQSEIETLVEKAFPYSNGQSGRAETNLLPCRAASDNTWSVRTTPKAPQPANKTWTRRSEDSGGPSSPRSTIASKDQEITRQEIVAMHRSILRELRRVHEQQGQLEERMIELSDHLSHQSAQPAPIAQARLASPFSPRPGRRGAARAASDRDSESNTGRFWNLMRGRKEAHSGWHSDADVHGGW